MVSCSIRGHFAEAWNLSGKGVDIGHPEIHSCLIGYCEKVQDCIGGASHRYVESHRIEEGLPGGDAFREHGLIPVTVVFPGVFDYQAGRLAEEFPASLVGGYNGAVSRQGEADSLCKTVHRVGREHSRAASAAGAGRVLDIFHIRIAYGRVGGFHHRIDEVQPGFPVHSGLHRASGNEDCRDIEPHCGHQHAGGDLVAVADAYHRIGLVRIDHVFHAVCDDVTGRKGVEHPVVSHRNAVVHCNCIEFSRIAAERLDFRLHNLADLMKMRVTGHKLGERIDNGNDGLPHLTALHPGCDPESPCSCHPPALHRD